MSQRNANGKGSGLLADGLWMSMSTSLRLGAGLLVFVVVARQLGAAAFGTLMASFSVAAIASIPVHHGLNVYVLREAPRLPDGGRELLGRGLGLKLAIFGFAFPTSVVLALALNANPLLVAILFVMHCIESSTELLCVRFRAIRQFRRETALMTTQACVHLALVGTVAYLYPTVSAVALAFLGSRLIGAGLAITVQYRTEGWLPRPCLRSAKDIHRESRSYFIDFGAQTSLNQLDVLLLNLLSNPVAVGVYQAGMRIIHGLSQAVTIMVNVALPRLSRLHADQRLRTTTILKVVSVFSLAGIAVAGPLASTADHIAELLYGTTFPGLPLVLQILAAFLLIRFVAAGSGVILIALGEQKLRAAIMTAAIGVLTVSGLFLIPRYGAVGTALAMTCAFSFVLIGQSALLFLRASSGRAGDRK